MNRYFYAIVLLLFSIPVLAQQPPVSGVLYPLLQSEGVEATIAKYHELKAAEAEKYDFSENVLNYLGYQLIAEKRMPEALAILKLNNEQFPDSPNSHDSYAEALFRSGDLKMAKKLYQKTLHMAENSGIPEQQKNFLIKNAKAKLAYLADPKRYDASHVLKDFVTSGEFPFGRLNPDAPPETASWGQLAGEWECTNYVPRPDGKWQPVGKAVWLWKYILDGYAVQDLWYQPFIEKSVTVSASPHDVTGTNVRMYRPKTGKWDLSWFVNSTNNTAHFTATNEKDGSIVMIKKEPPLQRVTFYDITENSFRWKSENSKDNGQTWNETFRIEGKRVK